MSTVATNTNLMLPLPLKPAQQSVSQMLQMSQKTDWAHNLISFNQVKTF